MTSFPLSSVEELKQQLQDKGVKYAMASYVDLHGVIKGKFVPLAHLGQMLRGSELYTGAALDGVPQEISDNEVAAMTDLNLSTDETRVSYGIGRQLATSCVTILRRASASMQ